HSHGRHDEERRRRRQPPRHVPVRVAEDGPGADERDADDDGLDDADGVRAQRPLGHAGAGPHLRRGGGDELTQLDEEEGREADEHVGADARPLAGGLALEPDESAEEEGDQRLGQREELLRGGVEHGRRGTGRAACTRGPNLRSNVCEAGRGAYVLGSFPSTPLPMSNAIRCVLLGTLAFLLAPGLAAQDTLRVTQVVVEGETVTLPGGGTGTVSTIQTSLFTNRNAEVGFSVDVQGDDGVWFGDAPIWLNSQATSHTLTGAEFTMGIGDNGEFIYSPSIDGNDGVWTDQGYLLADGDPAPGFEGDTLVTFNSRPTMGANGT